MQILDVDLFIYKPRMNVKQILLVSKEAFKVILGLFQAGWQMISSLYVEKLVLGPNLFIMKIFNSTHQVLQDILIKRHHLCSWITNALRVH